MLTLKLNYLAFGAQPAFTCVQNCKKDEGPKCGGKHKNWEVLHRSLEKCCDFHLKWKSEECKRHESGSRRLTDSQKEEDHQHLIHTDTMINREGLDVIKNMEGRLEDVSNTMEGKLAWVESNDKEIKGDIEELKNEVKEMKNDMKDIKALLAELVGRK